MAGLVTDRLIFHIDASVVLRCKHLQDSLTPASSLQGVLSPFRRLSYIMALSAINALTAGGPRMAACRGFTASRFT